MTTAIHLRRDLHSGVTAPNVQCANTFRTIKFVGCQRKNVNAVFVYVDWNFANCLYRIAMNKTPFSLAIFAISAIG